MLQKVHERYKYRKEKWFVNVKRFNACLQIRRPGKNIATVILYVLQEGNSKNGESQEAVCTETYLAKCRGQDPFGRRIKER